MPQQLQPIVAFLDGLLQPDRFQDSSNNGLQVENSGRVGLVCCGVDASMDFFREAQRRGAGLVLCHHGLSWGDSLKRITHLNYQRVSFLIKHDIAVYAAHLPLDAHPRYGNNACVARALGLRQLKPFGMHQGQAVGLRGTLAAPVPLRRLAARLERTIGNQVTVLDFGKSTIRTVAMVVGGGAVGIEEAARLGVDVYLSGEPGLGAYNTARHYQMNALFGGHYATESLGVQALGKLLTRRFGVRTEFVDLGIRF